MSLLSMVDISKTYQGVRGRAEALRGVSLEVEPGSSIAVIGRNGAGKTTLLKIAAGLISPTGGTAHRVPRCVALLDMGMAFHPDLSGRENLDVGLALGGRNRRGVARVRDEAIEFAGLEGSLERQVKHYSNGMIARLACAIAVFSNPELLLIDEVLAVGDLSFQRTMLDRVNELIAEGTSMVMVTHSPELAVIAASHALWLEQGQAVDYGPTGEILKRYQASTGGAAKYVANPTVHFEQVTVSPHRIAPDDPLHITAHVDLGAPVPGLTFRAELRPIVGTDEPWMRDPDEPIEHRHLNLIATTAPLPADELKIGRHKVGIVLEHVPFTPSSLEVSVVACDRHGDVIDELSTEFEIGTSPQRPQFLLEPRVGPRA